MLRGLLATVEFLTVCPVPGKPKRGPEDLGRGAWAFPLVGLLIGGVLVALSKGLAHLFPEPVPTFLLVAVWIGVTGGLHLDGLADTLDGLGGGWGRDRSLAIMRDARIGSYGVIGIVLALILLAAAVLALHRMRTAGLLLAPTLGRLTPLLLSRLCPPARPNGLGFDFVRGLTLRGFFGGLVIIAAATFGFLGWWGFVLLGWLFAITAVLSRYFIRRLGGVTGDLLGASVVVSELLVVLILSAFEHLELA